MWAFPILLLAATVVSLSRAQVSTSATCSTASWTSNAKSQSPCLVASYLQTPCNSGTFDIPALSSTSNSYTPPGADARTAPNACICSWASYNLLQACTICQGYNNGSLTWARWSSNCASFLTGSYWPASQGFVVPTDTSIPYWAATDPTSWNDGRFNATQAQDIQKQGRSDVTGAPINGTNTSTPSSSSSSGPPVGPIVGGVIGGLVVVGALGWLTVILIRRRRRQTQTVYSVNGGQTSINPSHPSQSRPTMDHWRSHSDSSAQDQPSMAQYRSFSGASESVINESGISAKAAAESSPPLGAQALAPLRRPPSRAVESTDSVPAQVRRLNPPTYSASAAPGSEGANIVTSVSRNPAAMQSHGSPYENNEPLQ